LNVDFSEMPKFSGKGVFQQNMARTGHSQTELQISAVDPFCYSQRKRKFRLC
jgi:hypothetical protein